MVNGINALDAISAYGRASGVGGKAPAQPAGDSAPGGDASFGDLVSDMVGSTADALGKAEQASMKQVAGKGDLIDVVTAIGAAETALDTVVAVRDRVVSAYQEIMRMQI
ncbi:MAG: flagellar hook-basal body complex protein FliE [Sphingobium sp.]|nr:flagellar hook-basal body complex protein FliE [Sphingobium sp.]MCP5399392.1 flagellar hook-basal body complex protein FliE [Sphingomonas sp.]